MSSFEKVSSTSKRMREAMNKANKKQVDLVNETGINRSAISRYLSGEYEPKQNAIYKLAKALDVSEMWLWGYECPMERPIEQKENDELVDLVERLKKDKGFRNLVVKLSNMNPSKLESIMNLLDVPEDQ